MRRSALGQKRTSRRLESMSAFLSKADVSAAMASRPLSARSGHQAVAPSFGTFGPVSAGGGHHLATAGAAIHRSAKARQAAALFLIAPTMAVSMAPPAPPAIACEMMPPTLKL